MNKVRAKDPKIEDMKGFSTSANTRHLQCAVRNIKCLQTKVEGFVPGSKINGITLNSPSKAVHKRLASQGMASRGQSIEDDEYPDAELDLVVKSFTHSTCKDDAHHMLSQTQYGSK